MKFRILSFIFISMFTLPAFLFCPNITGDESQNTNIEYEKEEYCKTIGPFDYGVCTTFLGYIFDGKECIGASGCDCGQDCENFYSTVAECNSACGIYACPDVTEINCMPIVLPEFQEYCETSYSNWIKENCPGVSFSY